MKNVLSISICSLLLLFLACTTNKKEYVAKVKLLKLDQDHIYDKEMVSDVIFDSEELDIDSLKVKSRQLFLEGIDEYKNKKNPEKAVALFKESILTFPDAKTYYELGNAKLDIGAKAGDLILGEAENAYEVARFLNFKPAFMIDYKRACIRNCQQKKEGEFVMYELMDAFSHGFSDTTMLKNDEHLKSFLNDDTYRTLKAKLALIKRQNNAESLFDIYKKSFAAVTTAFEIPVEKVDMKDYKQSISYDFSSFIPEMQTSSFSREVSHDFIFVAKVAEKENYTALLYSSINYYGEDMQPVRTQLVTYDTEGNIISSKLFAGQFSAEKIKTGRIEGDQITLQDYKRVWKEPIDKVPFEENTVDKYELLAKATFRINEEGKILQESVPSNYMDSVIVVKN